MKTFVFPSTPTTKVIYVKDGVTYAGVITTPATHVDLLRAMTARQARVDQIQSLEPMEPKREHLHSHPFSHHRAAKLVAETQ